MQRGALKFLESIQDPVKRRAYFVSLLGEEMKAKGGEEPVIVGGEAVEIYTQGSYTTGDIDLLGDRRVIEEVLKQWGFLRLGRVWVNKELDLYVDIVGGGTNERVEEVELDEGKVIKVISIEDLIVDRLNAYRWWGDTDSKMWALVLKKVAQGSGRGLDEDYLRERLRKESLLEVWKEVEEVD